MGSIYGQGGCRPVPGAQNSRWVNNIIVGTDGQFVTDTPPHLSRCRRAPADVALARYFGALCPAAAGNSLWMAKLWQCGTECARADAIEPGAAVLTALLARFGPARLRRSALPASIVVRGCWGSRSIDRRGIARLRLADDNQVRATRPRSAVQPSAAQVCPQWRDGKCCIAQMRFRPSMGGGPPGGPRYPRPAEP